MSTLIHYIREKGDRSFKEVPFNEVDGLILAHASMYDYSKLNMSEGFTFSEVKDKKQIEGLVSVSEDKENDFQMVKAMSETKRFRNIQILDYQSIISSELKENFGAVACELPNREGVIAFKGSDASFLSWEENFNLAFLEPIPSLQSAIRFLEKTLENSSNRHHVVGHSKGGYLATGASLKLPKAHQNKILQVNNYDGPGIFQLENHKRLLDQFEPEINKYITESSFVGRMFEKSDRFRVIESTAAGSAQHRPHTWKVKDTSFVYLQKTSYISDWVGDVFNRFIDELDHESASDVVETLFEVLNESKFSSFSDFQNVTLDKIKSVYAQRENLDKETYHTLFKTFKVIVLAISLDAQENVVEKSQDKKEMIINYVMEYKAQLSKLGR